ncbi:MAG: type II toxin-antitoxin system Phd/YefM family antitoxin [Oscillospiraceae bacterium]|nr:type II toxin-antitoxin system Phd/YefM family antitoxin [Oscillospiraceae bacterium]
MNIRPSTSLRNEYLQISALAKSTGEPIFITNKGEADGVFMSVEAFEQREKMLAHRASILEAELARLSGGPTYSIEDVRSRLKEKYRNG